MCVSILCVPSCGSLTQVVPHIACTHQFCVALVSFPFSGKSQGTHQPAVVPEKPADTGQWSVAGKGKGKRVGSDGRGEPFRGPAERDFDQKHEGASLKDGQQSHMQQGQSGCQPQQGQYGTQPVPARYSLTPYEGPSVGATVSGPSAAGILICIFQIVYACRPNCV